MKFGIVSDAHSNYHALKAVLEHMDSVGVDKKVSLGDTIGYGPRPRETLALTLEHFNYIVMGNHDLAGIDEEESWGFNPSAKEAIDWTRKKLKEDDIEFLSNLEYGHKVNDTLFIHGSPANHFSYILDHSDAKVGFASPVVDFKVAFVGHTHLPFVWYEDSYIKPQFGRAGVGEFTADVPQEGKAIFNVGSVGQPRDGDSRATYAIYDTDTQKVTIYKVPYAIDRTIGLMQREGFSEKSIQRLMFGR